MRIPNKVSDFRAYFGLGQARFIGLADAELPSFEPISDEVKGAGIQGSMNIPTPGQFGPQSLKLKFRTADAQVQKTAAGVYLVVSLWAAEQAQDTDAGAIVQVPNRYEVRGPVMKVALGKLEQGKVMDAEIEVEVLVFHAEVDGIETIHLDKLASVYRVDGVDQLADVRAATGG